MSTNLYKSLAILGGPGVSEKEGRLHAHVSYGRVIEELAGRFGQVILSVSHISERTAVQDYALPDNVRLVPLPPAGTALQGFLTSRVIARAYREAIIQADAVFVRGVLIPAVDVIYEECRRQDKPVCHWLVGNPMALLQSHQRDGWVKDSLGKAFVWWWERQLHRGHRRARAAYLCNGQEIADRHPSPQNHVVVSTTLTENDLYEREDTCQADPVRILSLCYIRPEKGIEYLIEAFARLRTQRPTELVLVGSRDRYPTYQAKLDALVAEHGLQDRVTWAGHASYHEVARHMQEADIFAFPTLSEGTPRVLVEARANSLPLVSTNVGGIPSSVTDGYDGLLVPPKDPQAMADAIERLVVDGPLRRQLIANGYRKAKELTVKRFVSRVTEILNQL